MGNKPPSALPDQEPTSKTVCGMKAVGRVPKAVFPRLKPQYLRCDLCAKRLSSFPKLKAHQKNHNMKTPFKCSRERCGLRFRSRMALTLHNEFYHCADGSKMSKFIRSTTWAVVTEENGRIVVRQPTKKSDDTINEPSLQQEEGHIAVSEVTSNGTPNQPPESE